MNYPTEVIEEYINQEKLYRTEGETGVKNLCKLVNALGYVDRTYFGQFSHDASYGDLLLFLEDNSCVIDLIIEWIKDCCADEWLKNIESRLSEE